MLVCDICGGAGRVRRKFKGAIPMANVGYGSNKKTRNILPNGFYKFLVHNVEEVDMLLMHNRLAFFLLLWHSLFPQTQLPLNWSWIDV